MAVSPAPAESGIVVKTVQQLLTDALIAGGIAGIDEAIEQPIINIAWNRANGLLAQWARKRWLCYSIEEYSITSTGAQTYTVGAAQNINISPRPDRLEYAYLRMNPTATTPVDVPLGIIQSKEDYSRIAVKNVGTLPWRVFYDPQWPVGVLYFWPVPQVSIYQMFVGFKVVLPRFASLQQQLNFPPEYYEALFYCLARRLRTNFQLPMDPELNALARDAVNSIRLADQAMSTLSLPRGLPGRRNRSYSYQSDDDGR